MSVSVRGEDGGFRYRDPHMRAEWRTHSLGLSSTRVCASQPTEARMTGAWSSRCVYCFPSSTPLVYRPPTHCSLGYEGLHQRRNQGTGQWGRRKETEGAEDRK